MASWKHVLFAGVAPRVVALDRATGNNLWATKLPGAGTLVTVSVDEDRVYAGSAGEVWALNPVTGSILWHNELKGFGMNDVMFAGTSRRQPPSE